MKLFVLSDQERALLMRLSLEHVAGRVPVIVTISHFLTGIVVARAKLAQTMKASDKKPSRCLQIWMQARLAQ